MGYSDKSYWSNFYVEDFPENVFKKFVILFNQQTIFNQQKYLFIVAQDVETFKIVRLVDFHGKNHDLLKYDDNWAKLKKGDIIKVACAFRESKNCVNVLCIKSQYELVETIDYYQTIKQASKAERQTAEKANEILQPVDTDLLYLAKKTGGRYGFALCILKDVLLQDYKTKTQKIKFQMTILDSKKNTCYADIVAYVPDIQARIGDLYSGFALLQFAYKNNRLRISVYDFLNEDQNFKEPFSTVDYDELPF